MQCTTVIPRGTERCNNCKTLLHCLGAVHRAKSLLHGGFGQCELGPPQYNVYYHGVVGIRCAAAHSRTAKG